MDAGLAVRVEPDTYSLLLGEFTKADCRRIFPKQASKQYLEQFQAVLNALEVVASSGCTLSAADKTAYVQIRIDALPILKKHELKGLRIDAALENSVTGETKWVDVSAMHTSCPSYASLEIKSAGQKVNVTNIAAAYELPDYLKTAPSPSLLKREAEKNHKYSRLIGIAQRQAKEKKRLQAPSFSAFIGSDFGDLSPVAQDLLEWIVSTYTKKCGREGERADGCSTAELTRV